MKRMLFVASLSVAGLLFCPVPPAQAQQRRTMSRYSPSRPTFSPYMRLYQRDSGMLTPYHAFVRPEQQLRRTLSQNRAVLQTQGITLQTQDAVLKTQAAMLKTQGAELRTLKQRVTVTEKGTRARPTGTGSRSAVTGRTRIYRGSGPAVPQP